MFIELEKSILSKNFEYYNDNNSHHTIWNFVNKDDPTKQISLQQQNKKYYFSFPINEIHYKTSFTDVNKLQNYISYILYSHI